MAKRLVTVGSVLVLSLALVASANAATNLYVSPQGNDAWPGTLAKPFRTLDRAQQAVRARTAGMAEDIVVNLRGGTYRLAGPLELSAAAGDSGRNGHRVVYQAYGYGTTAREQATVSGGRRITGWTLSDPAKNIWSAAAAGLETRQLYVNGTRARRASRGAGLPGSFRATQQGYVTDSAAPQSWSHPQDIEITYQGSWVGSWPWTDSRCGIDQITGNASRTVITMDQPCYDMARDLYELPLGGVDPGVLVDPTDITNSKSFLNQPGEFYVDRGEGRVYYIPRAGENLANATVVAPELETLISGTGASGGRLHDVSFRGLKFFYGTWLEPSGPTGYVHVLGSTYLPGGEQIVTVPGQVRFRNADDIVIEGNQFAHLGGLGLEISGNGDDNVVRGNTFSDISDGAIAMGVLSPERSGDVRNGRIDNNWVHDIGVEYRGAVGIWTPWTKDTTLANNQVNATPYSGIVSGPIDEDVPGLATGQRIVKNRVFNTMQVLDDGGGIYMLGQQGTSFETGAVIHGNAVYDGPPGVVHIGLYTDATMNWGTITDNVVFGYPQAAGGCIDPFVKNLRYSRNFWDQAQPTWDFCEGLLENVTFSAHTTLPQANPRQACESNPTCAAILAEAGLEPAYRGLLQTVPGQ